VWARDWWIVEGATPADELERCGVSSREREVLSAVADRRSNAEIASLLGLSERTVESHVSSLLRKLGVSSRRGLEPFAGAERLGDPAARRGVPLALQRLRADGTIFGREAETEALVAAWESSRETQVALVRGEAGIGKSRLVAELAAEVHRRGGDVALGQCRDGTQRPFDPLIDALQAVDAGLEQEPTLARLVGPASGDDAELVDPERERFRAQAGLIEAMVRATERRGLLVVIEDLHWASAAALGTLELLARSPRAARLLVVGTTRDAGTQERYGAFLGRLGRAPGVTTVALTGLDLDAATRLIASERSALDPVDGVARSGGNPLFLRALARYGAASRSMGEAVADLFTRLDDDQLGVVDVAVVSGDPIDARLVARASARHLDEVLDALERAESVGIVRAGEQAGTFVFTHDVYRSGREAMMTTGQRMRVHALLAAALDGPDLDDRLVPTLARHAVLAGPRFDPTRAAALSRRAGELAMRAADHGSAAEHYRRALDAMALGHPANDADRSTTTIALGEALMLSGQRDGESMLRGAVHEARRRDDPVAVAAALTAMANVPGGHTPRVLGQDFEALVVEAIERLPQSETAWRVRLIATLGSHLYVSDDVERAGPLLDQAVRLARGTNDPVTLGRALMAARWGGGPFAMSQRLACGHELVELGERTGQDVFTLVGCQQLAWCHDQLGDLEGILRWRDAARRLVRGPDLEQLTIELTLAVRSGDLVKAERISAEIVDLDGPHGVYGGGSRACLNEVRGRPLAPATIEAAIDADPALRWRLEPVLARSLARAGHVRRATAVLAEVRARGYGPRSSVRWTMAMGALAEAATLCGDVEVAADLAELLTPLAGLPNNNGLVACDSIDRARALCLLTLGDAAGAAALARAAAATSERQAAPILRARELVVAVRADQELRRPVDEAQLREALATAHRTGARIIVQDARQLLGPQAIDDDDELTRREREVVDHVALGATNRQIARSLGISEATVRKHLEAVFRKLGVSTRTAAVARSGDLHHPR
jgi:DNA-binding NarL/FixJ family response regulator